MCAQVKIVITTCGSLQTANGFVFFSLLFELGKRREAENTNHLPPAPNGRDREWRL
jgi:hypothetical protein